MTSVVDVAEPAAARATRLAPLRVALVGNPNSGKTAMFNALTGSRQKVANYAGVTVERKEGHLTAPSGRTINVLDLPGTYSLRARSPDEVVTRDAVLGRLAGETPPDVVICVADATNLRLVLRLALELKAVGRPCVLALNMIDIAQRLGLEIDTERLSHELSMPVVGTVATRKRGIDALVAAVEAASHRSATAADWREPSAGEIRALHREAERILKACVRRAQAARHLDRPAGQCPAQSGRRDPDPAGHPVPDVPGRLHRRPADHGSDHRRL